MTTKRTTKRKSPGAPERYTKKQIIDALERTGGYITVAAKKLKCHYATVANYIKKYPEIKAANEQIQESYIDMAEHSLITKIKDGDTTANIFYLKCKGKKRGYVERQEITGADGKNLLTFADLARKATKD